MINRLMKIFVIKCSSLSDNRRVACIRRQVRVQFLVQLLISCRSFYNLYSAAVGSCAIDARASERICRCYCTCACFPLTNECRRCYVIAFSFTYYLHILKTRCLV